MMMLKQAFFKGAALALCVLISMSVTVASAQTSAGTSYFLSIQGPNIYISYTMDDAGNAFVESVMERLKAGQVLNIQHSVRMQENRWLGAEVAALDFTWQISYNHLQDGFYIQEEGKPQTIPMSEKGVQMLLLSVPERSFVQATALQKAQEYVLTFTTNVEVANKNSSRWVRWLSFNERFFKPKLSAEVIYIAR